MATPIRIAVFILGGVFSLIGIAGLFQPEILAKELGVVLSGGEGAGAVRAMIGAHYAAMGGICIFAAIRQTPVLLLPIGVIEAVMVFARGLAAANGEFVASAAVPTVIELIAAAVLLSVSVKALNSHR